MMKLTMNDSTRNLNLFNIILAHPYWELLEEKLCHELGLESLQCRRWYRKLCLFYKIFKEKKKVYLFNLIPSRNSNCNTRNTDTVTSFHTKHNVFKNSFFSIHCY